MILIQERYPEYNASYGLSEEEFQQRIEERNEMSDPNLLTDAPNFNTIEPDALDDIQSTTQPNNLPYLVGIIILLTIVFIYIKIRMRD